MFFNPMPRKVEIFWNGKIFGKSDIGSVYDSADSQQTFDLSDILFLQRLPAINYVFLIAVHIISDLLPYLVCSLVHLDCFLVIFWRLYIFVSHVFTEPLLSFDWIACPYVITKTFSSSFGIIFNKLLCLSGIIKTFGKIDVIIPTLHLRSFESNFNDLHPKELLGGDNTSQSQPVFQN